eukprot:NODE_1060_length_2390_cov_0.245744.p3 type:complete len:145 gc:universal NODE_1060_length_2390_cov_0.245744:1361-1795(+)
MLFYLDDLLIYASLFEVLLDRFQKVLNKLALYGLTFSAKKCYLGMTEVDFLGFKVSTNEIQPTEAKIEAVKAFKPPRNITEIRQFVGFASFYRCFIHKYATLSQPQFGIGAVLVQQGRPVWFVSRSLNSITIHEKKYAWLFFLL